MKDMYPDWSLLSSDMGKLSQIKCHHRRLLPGCVDEQDHSREQLQYKQKLQVREPDSLALTCSAAVQTVKQRCNKNNSSAAPSSVSEQDPREGY